jgi:hypothetical protein
MKNELLNFDKMITPKIITFIYWILLIASIGIGLYSMFGGYGKFTISKFLIGLITIGFGFLISRIWCELLIVTFKINENLKKIADKE